MSEGQFFRWRPHPWHGLPTGPEPPVCVHAYIELTPFDLVKYEVDKYTGYLRVDRPQRTSSSPPTMYGFIPRTYCAARVAALSSSADKGDGDPLDICVISERQIDKSEIILNARVVGAIRSIDKGEADDKIIAVLENDPFWGNVADVSELPPALVERLRHYFSTYKTIPGQENQVRVEETLGSELARKIVEAAMQDYQETFGSLNRNSG
jgi:inorganic pyrophosphatase